MSADKKEPQAQASECGLGSEQIDRAVGKDRSRPAMTSIESGDSQPGLVRTLRIPRLPPAQAEAQDRAARIAFIDVLLRFRKRLIAEGKLPRDETE